ncbi:MAG: hypothetical protein ACKVT0_22525 [Planctomycetaceae bacterium]
MRIIALVCLLVAVAFLLLLNGQVYTNSLVSMMLATVASILLLIAARIEPRSDTGSNATSKSPLRLQLIAALAMTFAVALVTRLPAAYDEQQQFNRKMDELRAKRNERKPIRSTRKAMPNSPIAGSPVEASSFTFTHPKLEALFHIVDRNACRLSSADWHHTPYHVPNIQAAPENIHYVAKWDRNKIDEQNEESFVRKFQLPHTYYHLTLFPIQPQIHPLLIRKMKLEVFDAPQNGWGGLVSIECNALTAHVLPEVKINYGVSLSRMGDSIEGFEMNRFSLQGSKIDNGLVFRYLNSEGEELDAETFRDNFNTAENFRDTALKLRDRWEENIREKFRGGPLLGIPVSWGGGRVPPKNPHYYSTDAQKDEILQTILSDVEHQRELIRNHYLEMHAALDVVFPLLDSLNEARILAGAPE